jgi:eukaryotic-like serine/threonine-protein kinase
MGIGASGGLGSSTPSSESVRSELDRILASTQFQSSERLRRFLQFIVLRALDGEGDQLKEYRIGLEVFGRSSSYDPRLDPVVRLEARRLRAKLKAYYEGEGQGDPLRIEVPKGGYVPCFVTATWSDVAPSGNVAGERSRNRRSLISPGWKWTLAAAAALLSAALVAGGFYYRSRQAERLTDKDTIVLADFANSTGDPVFDDALKTALTVSLQQSPFLNVLSDQKVAATLQTMARPAGTKLTADVTRELCQRVGSKAYIAGAIANLGGEYVLGLKAVNCQSGDTLAQEQVTAASKEKVLNVLGNAASKLRSQLGESLATVKKFDVPLVAATTPSLEALKAFSLGQEAYRKKGPEAALPYDREAIELDPNFALAYFQAGSDYHSLSQLGRAEEYIAKAFQLRERVSERERLAIAAFYYRNVTGEVDKAIQTDQEEIRSYPSELYGYIRLGVDFSFLGKYEQAREVTLKALSLDPDHVVPYDNLTAYLLALQRLDEARQIVQQARARKLDNIMLHATLYELAFLKNDTGAMANEGQWFSGTPLESFGLALSSDTEAFAGRVRRAREIDQRAVTSAIHADSKEIGALWQENGALRDAAFGDDREARQEAVAGLKIAPMGQGVDVEAALAFAMAGDASRAESMALELDKRFPLDTQMQSLWLPTIRAQLALNRNNPASALRALQVLSPIELALIPLGNNVSCLYPIYVRGEAYLAAGQGSPATAEFQKILDHSGIVWNCWTGALAHLGVARANALQSRTSQGADADAARVRALTAYKDFLTLWRDADSDIPILKQAKAEYAKLQ